MIRPATVTDLPRIIELGNVLHQTTSYVALAYSPEKAKAFLRDLITGVIDGVVFVVEVDGVVIGGMAGGIVDQWFSDELIAYDYGVFIEPGRRGGIWAHRLVTAFQAWARLKGASMLQMGIGTSVQVEGTTRLYQSIGLEIVGPLLMKRL